MRKVIIIILLCWLLMIITGCWSSIELRDSAFVSAVAIEKEGEEFKATFQMLEPQALGAGGEGSSDGNAQLIHVTLGVTAHDSIRSAIKGAYRRIFLSHAMSYVVSSEIAKEGIIKGLDIVYRDPMFRLTSYVFIAEDPAKMLSLQAPLDDLSGLGFAEAVEESKDFFQQAVTPNLKEFLEMMYAPGRCAYAVILKEHLEEPQDRPHADLGHTAIFKEGKYVKAVDPNRSKALRYFRNEMGNGTTSIKLSEEDGWTAIERLGTETKMTPRLEGESLVVDVEVSIKGNINEWHSEKKINEETYRQVEEAVSHTVKKNMEALLEVVRSEPITDVINIGVEVHRQMPGYWQSVKENWDDAFKNAQINISVDTELINYNLIERTSIPEEEDIGGPRKSIFPWKN